jgi:hypothetical protein
MQKLPTLARHIQNAGSTSRNASGGYFQDRIMYGRQLYDRKIFMRQMEVRNIKKRGYREKFSYGGYCNINF